MFNFFESIAGIVDTVIGYVVGIFEMLVNLVIFIFKAQGFLLEVVTSLPPFMLTFAVVFISLAILYQILNKGA